MRHSLSVTLLFLIGLAAPPVTGAQSALPEPPRLESGTPVSHGFATAGAVVGTAVYAPFKALLLCPTSALVAGATYAVTAGAKQPAAYLLDLGCTGTYVIRPGMIEGGETFHAIDEYPK